MTCLLITNIWLFQKLISDVASSLTLYKWSSTYDQHHDLILFIYVSIQCLWFFTFRYLIYGVINTRRVRELTLHHPSVGIKWSPCCSPCRTWSSDSARSRVQPGSPLSRELSCQGWSEFPWFFRLNPYSTNFKRWSLKRHSLCWIK